MSSSSYISVSQAYAGKTLFVTGTTGCVGKILLEKILYALPEVKRVYVLVREKKGISASERFEQLIKSPVFTGAGRVSNDVLRAKITLITGDLETPGLGLDDRERTLLVNEVNFVFHVAANVRFDNSVVETLKSNFLGAKSVADLCHEIEKLEAFINVSSCFSNCNLAEIEEKVYKTKVSGESLMEKSTIMTNDQVDKYAKDHLFEGRPNGYVLAKALAENYVADTCQDLPVAIVRLPMVVPPLNEPEPSFTDTIAAVNFLVLAVGLGTLRTFKYDPKIVLPMMPVDYIASALILTGYDIALSKKCQVKTINIAQENIKHSMGGFMRTLPLALEHGLSYKRMRPVANVSRPPNLVVYAYKKYILEFAFAMLVDLTYLIRFKKPSAFSNMRKLSNIRDQLEYFMCNAPKLHIDNFKKLQDSLDSKDQDTFNIRMEDVRQVLTDRQASLSYTTACVESFMKYKFNETVTPEDTADRKKFTKRLEYQESIMLIVLHTILCGLIYLVYWVINSTVDAMWS